jgi:hypothetical protein
MSNKNYKLICRFIFFLILIFFFYGFFIQEDASGGGQNDFTLHIYNNILLFKNYDFLDIPWSLYDSSSLPLYYLITKYLIPLKDPYIFKLFTFFLSLISVLIFYKILKKKYYEIKNHNHIFLLISVIPLLSPYFRTSAFWGIEENIAYFFFLLAGYFYFKDLKKPINFFLLIFFASITFYGRQNYAFLSIIIFLYLFNFKTIFVRRNIYIIFLFTFFLLPSLYFFIRWGGVKAPTLTSPRHMAFNIFNIPIILSILFFYYIPLIVINLNYYFKKFISINKFIILIIAFLIFLFIFKEDPEILFERKLGGGVLYKLIFNFGLLNNYKNFASVLFLFISFLGLLFSIFYCKKNFKYLIYFVISLFLFSFGDIIFQEYFDPLAFFVIFIFCNFFSKKEIIKVCNSYLIFYSLLIISTLIYRNYI